MAQNSWPFDNQDTTETQYSALFSRLRETGVWGSLNQNQLLPFADSSGMQIKVPAGMAFVRGHFYENTAQLTLVIGASAASARIDTVVLRLDPAANSIVLAVVAGTPGSGSPATLTQTSTGVYEMPLAYVTVGASVSTISAGSVSDRRPMLGDEFGQWTTDRRPSSPRMGRSGFNSTIGRPEYWTGSEWREFSPASIAASIIEGVLALANIPNLPADRITSGEFSLDRIPVIPVTKGGTGGTTVTAAQQALNIYVQSAAPAHSAGRVWIKRP